VTALHYQTGKPVTIAIRDGRIREAAPRELSSPLDELPYVAPGLVDLQINGYGGIDLNGPALSPEDVSSLVRSVWREGVTTLFPTIITNRPETIEQAMRSVDTACRRDSAAAQGIGGVHLEGPFISPHDGPRGAHPKSYVRPPDWEWFRRWQDAAGGRIRLITLSPEWPGSCEFIARCVESGVVVSIGHTAAAPEQIRAACDAGATMSTHLGNGAHLMLPRHPNYLWEQLADDRLWCSLIADGFHLPDQVLKVALKVKGSRAILVSDAVSLSGMPPGLYKTLIGDRVVLTPEGRLHMADNEHLLAGSVQMLTRGIDHLTGKGIAALPDAWEMASLRPARLLRLAVQDGIVPGAPADLVLFRHDDRGKIRIIRTYKTGRLVYAAD
jgi:N-acetylglucosamine-6-phosphate deacetylase